MLFRREDFMKALRYIGVVVVLAGMAAWAQTDVAQQPSDSTQPASSAPAGAFGQDEPAPQVSQFPPLSGLDEATLEPNYAARSFLIPGFQITEMADSNASNSLKTGAGSFTGDTHMLGSLALQRIWRKYQASVDYRGGASIYTGHKVLPNSQVHAMDLDNRILWRTGALSIRDSFSYLPEGIFGGGFGGVAGAGGIQGGTLGGGMLGGGAGQNFFGGPQYGALGSSPRIMNISVVDLQNSLSPRSAVTLAGGYALSHFTTSSSGLIDSRQITAQAGYNYALSRRNTVAVSYGFQQFTFPFGGGARFNDHVVQLLFGHQISGRMDLIIGGGPQFVSLSSGTSGSNFRISGAGRATLRYRFRKASVSLGYDRYETAGAGLFAGATTDMGRFSVMRPISRRWDVMGDIGYSHNQRVQASSLGVNAGSYDYGYAGGRLTHTFNRSWQGFLMYQFNNLRLNTPVCTGTLCGNTSNRHVIGIGVAWHPQAIRLD